MASRPEKEVVVLKHVPNEGAGTIADFLKKKKIRCRFIALYRGETIDVDFARTRAVCLMGGPMNVYEERKHPFLRREDLFVGELIRRDFPTLGVCLGAQLIAKAAGARVYKAVLPEVGWSRVHLTRAAQKDPLFSGAPFPFFQVLQWHEDTFNLPAGSELLASGSLVPHQAFRLKKNIYGLQFHLEADRRMLEDWFKKRRDLKTILGEFDAYRGRLSEITEKMYGRFLGV